MSTDTNQEASRIEIPSRFKCTKHTYYADDKPCPDCRKEMSVGLDDLHNKINLPIAAFIDDNGVMQIVINTTDEKYLWAAWKRMEKAIDFILHQVEMKRQSEKLVVAPASVLDGLRGQE